MMSQAVRRLFGPLVIMGVMAALVWAVLPGTAAASNIEYRPPRATPDGTFVPPPTRVPRATPDGTFVPPPTREPRATWTPVPPTVTLTVTVTGNRSGG